MSEANGLAHFHLLAVFDQVHGVFVATVEQYAKTPEEIASLGQTPLERVSYPFAGPIGVTVAFNAKKSAILVHVHHAPGTYTSIIEISADPIGLAMWKRLEGTAAKQSLFGYPPGLY